MKKSMRTKWITWLLLFSLFVGSFCNTTAFASNLEESTGVTEQSSVVTEEAKILLSSSYDIYKTKVSINARKDASTATESYGLLEKGQKVSVLEEKKGADGNVWGKISYNGSDAWISLKYCTLVSSGSSTIHLTEPSTTTTESTTTTTESATTTTTESTTTTTTESATTTTTEPTTTTTEPTTTTTTESTTTTTTETTTTTTTEESTNTTTEPTTTTEESTQVETEVVGYKYVVKSSVNMRKGVGSSYAVVANIPAGTELIVTEYNAEKTWGKTVYNGMVGWFSVRYATYEGEVTQVVTTTTATETTTEATTETTTEAPQETTTESSSANNPVYVYKINSASLNMREGAGTGYGIVGSLTSGEEVVVSEYNAQKTWGKTTYNGVTGWFMLKYATLVGEYASADDLLTTTTTEATTTTTTEATTTTTKVTTTKTTTDADEVKWIIYTYKVVKEVHLRKSMSTDSASLGIIPVGTVLTITERNAGNHWGKTTYNGKTGYVSIKYLELVSKSYTDFTPAPENGSPTTSTSTTTSGVKYKVTATALNMRSGPSSGYSLVTTVPSGATVVVTSTSNGWGKTTYNGKTGWICLTYCTKIGTVTSSTTTTTTTTTTTDSTTNINGTSGFTGWKKVNSVWTWYTNGTKFFASNNMYNAAVSIEAKTSGTSYYVCVNTTSCEVYIFKRANGMWVPYKLWKCTPGASATPTKKGTFTLQDRGYSFGVENSYTCYYWTRITGGILFHSVLYYWNSSKIKDGRLGYNLSHGCVRLDINNAIWIYNHLAAGTKVYVY